MKGACGFVLRQAEAPPSGTEVPRELKLAPLTRRAFVFAVVPGALAGAPGDIAAVFGRLAGALSDGDAEEFMRAFDSSMPDRGKLKSAVSALLEEAQVSSSVEILSDDGSETKRQVVVDWLMEVKTSLAGAFERRRSEVRCAIERRKDRWLIVALSPIDFFRPPGMRS